MLIKLDSTFVPPSFYYAAILRSPAERQHPRYEICREATVVADVTHEGRLSIDYAPKTTIHKIE